MPDRDADTCAVIGRDDRYTGSIIYSVEWNDHYNRANHDTNDVFDNAYNRGDADAQCHVFDDTRVCTSFKRLQHRQNCWVRHRSIRSRRCDVLLAGHHQIEIDPTAGFFWPGHFGGDMGTHLKDEGLYSLKAAAYLNDHVQLEGNFGYISHFESRLAPTSLDQLFGIPVRTTYGLLYDINGVWNFGQRPVWGARVNPYVTAGIGGLSTLVRHGDTAVFSGQFYTTDPVTGNLVLDTRPKIVLADNSAFFTFNYGGGIKTAKMWGPMGVRADVRGRTFPNFRGSSMNWLEASGGLTFTFGER